MRIRCPLCGGGTLRELPILSNAGQGMISDGRLVSRSIHKSSCLACGAAFWADPPKISEVSDWYSDGYSLAVAAPDADANRARLYADWLIEQGLCQGELGRLLDVGAGSGRLLQVLADQFTNADFVGCEPSLPRHARLSSDTMVYKGGIEAVPAAKPFQAIIAINVIEHTTDPATFLASLAARLAPSGKIFVVCPNGSEPNFELVFVDHLYSLTPASMAAAARVAGLSIEASSLAPTQLGLFSLYRLSLDMPSGFSVPDTTPATSFTALADRRAAYLDAWVKLDKSLLARTGGEPCMAFGAGQMAALLRAYAPVTWRSFMGLSLDVPSDAWLLDKSVSAYTQSVQPDAPIVLAVSPATHAMLARRLADDRYRPIRFDDIIPC